MSPKVMFFGIIMITDSQICMIHQMNRVLCESHLYFSKFPPFLAIAMFHLWMRASLNHVDFFLVYLSSRQETINTEEYIKTLTGLKTKIRPERTNLPIDNVHLLHENAWCYKSARTGETITSFDRKKLAHFIFSAFRL